MKSGKLRMLGDVRFLLMKKETMRNDDDADADAGPSLRTFFEGHFRRSLFGGHYLKVISVMVISIKVISIKVIIRRSYSMRSLWEDVEEKWQYN